KLSQRWQRLCSPYTALAAIVICGGFIFGMNILQHSCYASPTYTGAGLKNVHRVNGIPPLEYITIWSAPVKLTKALIAGGDQFPVAKTHANVADVRSVQINNREVRVEVAMKQEIGSLYFKQ